MKLKTLHNMTCSDLLGEDEVGGDGEPSQRKKNESTPIGRAQSASGKSGQELAADIGVAPSTISRWKGAQSGGGIATKGKGAKGRKPSMDTAKAAAKKLRMPLSSFLKAFD